MILILDDWPMDSTYRKCGKGYFSLCLFSRLAHGLINRKNTYLTSRNAKAMDFMLNRSEFCLLLAKNLRKKSSSRYRMTLIGPILKIFSRQLNSHIECLSHQSSYYTTLGYQRGRSIITSRWGGGWFSGIFVTQRDGK